MRRIALLVIVLMLVSVASFAQNYIGMNKDFIVDQLKSSSDYGKIEFDKLDDLSIIKYASNDLKTRKVIFLDKNGNCSKFIIIHNNYDMLKYVKKDMNQNYVRSDKNTWIQKGIVDCMWQLDKKQKFFALVVTKSNESLSMNLK